MSSEPADEVWACASAGDRPGDLDQVNGIAWALDPQYRTVDLHTEFARLQEARNNPGTVAPALPKAIIGIGRRRMAMAMTIRAWSGGRTKLIHIGRARGALKDIDYLVTTPAFPAPASAKVLELDVAISDRIRRLMSDPAAAAKDPRLLAGLSERGIGRPWINVFVGAPLRGDAARIASQTERLACNIDRLAARHGRDVLISGAPRTPPELYDILSSALTCRHYLYRWQRDDPLNPFELMVAQAGDSVVTADSITMMSQLVAAGHRVLVFPWRAGRPRRSDTLLKALGLGQRPAKDVAAFRTALYRQGLAAELAERVDFDAVAPRPDILNRLFDRLRAFLR